MRAVILNIFGTWLLFGNFRSRQDSTIPVIFAVLLIEATREARDDVVKLS